MVQAFKYDIVNQIKEKLNGAKAIVLVDYKGINIEEVNQLRGLFRTEKVDYFVQKNTLIKIALNDLGISTLDEYLVGPTAVAISYEDEITVPRVLTKFLKDVMEDKDFPSFKAGLVAGHIFDSKQLCALASLPSRNELLSKIIGSAQAPISRMLSVSQGIICKFVYALDAIVKKQAEAS